MNSETLTKFLAVEFIDKMGNDDSVVNAARVSFNKTAEQFSDEKNASLIEYLAKHKHLIPFAHTAITLRIKAPIAIRTQCFKHKIGFVENEVSRRYVTETPSIYIPTWRKKAENLKQGSLNEIHEDSDVITEIYKNWCQHAVDLYQQMIDNGVAAEQARFILPQGMMTEWVWTGSLLAFARFYHLRTSEHAQAEIRQLAEMIGVIIEQHFPIAWQALKKYGSA